ncbi:hypothetical protein JCM3765_006583 [Sporobolomyces pararoseus]
MTSITTFAYGITVQVPELITASRAWPALEPVFNFFDLLFLRRKQGTLRIHQQEKDLKRSILEKVPVEVWEETRQWVVPFHRLVAAFGLAHPLPRTIALDIDEWYSLDDIAFISIPCGAQRAGSCHSTISAEAGYEDQDEQTMVDVSFDLPLDADLRFLRFVRTFNLKVVEVSNGTLKCLPPNPEAKPLLQSKLAGIEKGGVKIVKDIKPTWKLYSSCMLTALSVPPTPALSLWLWLLDLP